MTLRTAVSVEARLIRRGFWKGTEKVWQLEGDNEGLKEGFPKVGEHCILSRVMTWWLWNCRMHIKCVTSRRPGVKGRVLCPPEHR